MLAVTLRENALTTLDALKTSLGIDPAEEDAQRDATLVQLINAASARHLRGWKLSWEESLGKAPTGKDIAVLEHSSYRWSSTPLSA